MAAKKKTQTNGQMSLDEYQMKELNVRLVLQEDPGLYSTTPIQSAQDAVNVMGELLRGSDREMVCVVNLDNRFRPINYTYSVVSIGGINSSMVPITNCFKAALLANSAAVMLLHSHPSGDVSPSREDFDVTKRFIQAGKLLDIPALDHIIVGAYQGEQYSFRQNNPDMFYEGPDLSVFPEIDTSKGWSVAERRSSYATEKPSVIGRLSEKQSQLMPSGSADIAKKQEYSL